MLIGEFEAAVRQADPDREPDTFKLAGELFTVSNRDLTIPLGRFARAAQSGLDSAELDGLAAIIGLLEAVVVEEDRARFLDTAERAGVDAEVLMRIVQAVVEAETGRPTVRPSDSSGGPSSTGENSKGSPSSEGESWRNSPAGRRMLAADPHVFDGMVTVDQAAMSLVV